jgi:ATP-dependent Lon protease
MGDDGVEKFVPTPELYSENSISGDPLPPGQVWVVSSSGATKTRACIRWTSLKARVAA